MNRFIARRPGSGTSGPARRPGWRSTRPRRRRLVPVVDAWALGWAADGAPVADTGATRVLDLRRGLLEREIEVRTPGGARLTLTATRLVSLVRREVVATRWHVRAHDAARVTALPVPGCGHADATGADDLDPEPGLGTTHCRHEPGGSVVHQRAHRSGRALAARTGHAVRAGDGTRVAWHPGPHAATLDADLPAGGWLEVEVLAAYAAGTDADALDGRAGRALAEARAAGWDRLLREQEAALDAVWERGDVRVEGDDVLQQAVRYALFQVVQASARVEGSGVRAKGLAGTGYHGHTFWDSECFVLPVLDHVLPEAAQAHLRWRHGTLALARERAAELGLPGAAFPWRTISGRECSGYWPAGTAAFHVGADVAFAAARHVATTGDEDFAREVGVDLLVATARLWAGRGHHAADGFHLDGVTGPDEYTAVVDDNAYTNLMARRNLRGAADAAERFPAEAGRLGVTADERAAWRRAADRMVVPYSPDLGVTEQHAGFTRHAPWDFGTPETARYPLADHAPFVELYRRQVVKQADLVLALHLAGEAFDTEPKRRDFAYYEPITVRDSSLSAPAQAVVAAEVGHPDLAYAYARECALTDLSDLRASTEGGLHVASLAGAWTALVAGLGGLRHDHGALHLAPRLPRRLTRLVFRVLQGGARAEVDVRPGAVTYRLVAGDAVRLTHHGEPVHLTADEPVAERGVPDLAEHPAPAQPPGRPPGFDAT
nr:glycosyl hydrolase family 65 protein [Cellulomonas hominis]